MRKRTQAREHALQMLYQYELNPEPAAKVFQHFWSHHAQVADETRHFAERLVQGTIENLARIDEMIVKYAENWDLGRMAVIDRNILRFAVFEIVFCEDIPMKVTINEAVNVAKKFSQEDSGKFVNGILDKISHAEKKTAPEAPHQRTPASGKQPPA